MGALRKTVTVKLRASLYLSLVAVQEADECRAASGHSAFVHRCDDFVQCAVRLFFQKRQNLFGIIFQRRTAP
jgi:hypothetical protein